jgi:hypothetical protein
MYAKALRTTSYTLFGRSDYARWGREDNLKSDWDSRTEQIAALVPPGSSVLEFGAAKMALRTFLPPSCTYTPSDIVDRGPGTLVCDLNGATLPAFPRNDIVVFSGVLEYVYDVDRLLTALEHTCSCILASYAVTDFSNQRTVVQRRRQGWVNEYSKEECIALFEKHGFICASEMQWRNQFIFTFKKTERI